MIRLEWQVLQELSREWSSQLIVGGLAHGFQFVDEKIVYITESEKDASEKRRFFKLFFDFLRNLPEQRVSRQTKCGEERASPQVISCAERAGIWRYISGAVSRNRNQSA